MLLSAETIKSAGHRLIEKFFVRTAPDRPDDSVET
jgi:hypothetical protein